MAMRTERSRSPEFGKELTEKLEAIEKLEKWTKTRRKYFGSMPRVQRMREKQQTQSASCWLKEKPLATVNCKNRMGFYPQSDPFPHSRQ